jgi:hypothetical protein
MNLLLQRDFDNGDDTIGRLFFKDISGKLRYVYTLEDQYQQIVVRNDTRIPAGQYEIILRKEGGVYGTYLNHSNKWIAENTKKYGILWLQGVPNFEYILIHIGNTDADTAGCILVGSSTNNNSFLKGFISESTTAYIQLVSSVFPAFDKNEKVFINIIDQDRNIQEQFK